MKVQMKINLKPKLNQKEKKNRLSNHSNPKHESEKVEIIIIPY